MVNEVGGCPIPAPKKIKKHFYPILRGMFFGLVFAGLFSSVLYVFAVPPTSKYGFSETLNPNCTPGATNCSVLPPLPYTGASSSIDFGTNNLTVDTNTLYVDATNNYVGIGTTSPSATLHVVDTTTGGVGVAKFEHYTSSTNSIGAPMGLVRRSTGNIADGFGPAISFSVADDTLSTPATLGYIDFERDGADNTGKFVIRPNVAGSSSNNNIFSLSGSTGYGYFAGRLGVGTATPDALLSVEGVVSHPFRVHADGWVDTEHTLTVADSWNTYYNGSALVARATGAGGSIGFNASGDFTVVTFPSVTAGNPTVQTTKVTVLNNGKVGIGTVSPSQLLEVSGSSLVTGTSYLENTNKKALSASTAIQNVYVDLTSGNDSTGDGTAIGPYKTVQKAVDSLPRVVTYNTFINVSNGSAPENIDTSGIKVFASLTFQAKDTSGNNLYDAGVATGGSTGTLQDTTKSWASNVFAGGKIFIFNGTGVGQIADIVSNTSNTITISGTWTTPDTTSRYSIVSPVRFTASSGDYTFLFQEMKNTNIYGFQFVDNVAAYSVGYYGGSTGYLQYCYFYPFKNGILADGNSSINMGSGDSYFSVPADQTGLVITSQSSSNPRGNVFVARTPGSGYGLYIYRQGFATLGYNSSVDGQIISYFKDLLYGVYTYSNGQVEGASTQTYSGCTTDYHFGEAVMGSINGLDAHNLGIGTTTPTKILSFGGNAERTIWLERNTTTHGSNLTMQAGGGLSGGTNLNGGSLYLSSGIATGSGSSDMFFQTATAGGTGTTDATPTTKFTVRGNGDVVVGTGTALATNATSGFLYIPSSAGTPVGTPVVDTTGTVPIQYDTTNNALYAYRGGGWRAIAETGGFQIPDFETADPISGEKMEEGDFVLGMIDKTMPNDNLHGIWVKWDSVKAQLLAEARGELSQTGTWGEGAISDVQTETLLDRVTNVLTSLGITFKDGVTNMTSLAVQNFTVKNSDTEIARIKKMEMVDADNGEIYCTWIAGGQWVKIKGNCDSSAVATAPVTQLETSEVNTASVQQISQQAVEQAAKDAVKEAKEEIKQEVKQEVKEELKQEAQQPENAENPETEAQAPAELVVAPSEEPATQELPQPSPEASAGNAAPEQTVVEEASPVSFIGEIIRNSTAGLINAIWEFTSGIFNLGIKKISSVPFVKNAAASILQNSEELKSSGLLSPKAEAFTANLYSSVDRLFKASAKLIGK